jgi:hypothetical protein
MHATFTAADLVIFSFDRPLQLYSLIESVEKYVTGVHEIRIVYRASTQAYEDAYQEVFATFSIAYAQRQSNETPQKTFKPLTLQAAFSGDCPYIVFAVDDIIVKDHVNLNECIDLLEKYNAYAFYLRLGTNLTFCYTMNTEQSLPAMQEIEQGIFAWRFSDGVCDWGYPHSVDMTLLRKKTIRQLFSELIYTSPNVLEARWADQARFIMNQIGLCYKDTKIVNVPLNRVQKDYCNRNMEAFTTQELLDIFNQGYKIDISLLHQAINPAAHTPYDFTFISR